MRYYKIQSAAANMPSSCWGHYKRIGLLEVDSADADPAMISDRARGVVRVVRTWERLHVGTSERCAFERAWREAETLKAQLEAEEGTDD